MVGAVGAASRYGSGSDQKMRLLAAPAPQHCLIETRCALARVSSSAAGPLLYAVGPWGIRVCQHSVLYIKVMLHFVLFRSIGVYTLHYFHLLISFKIFCFREKFHKNRVYFSRKFSRKQKTPIFAKILSIFRENVRPNLRENLHFNPSWRDLPTLVLNDTFRSSVEERLK
jgi:hypothetical protein